MPWVHGINTAVMAVPDAEVRCVLDGRVRVVVVFVRFQGCETLATAVVYAAVRAVGVQCRVLTVLSAVNEVAVVVKIVACVWCSVRRGFTRRFATAIPKRSCGTCLKIAS